jgi:hypothetical protein
LTIDPLLSKSVRILNDDIEEDSPIAEFTKYRDTIVRMIIGSEPKFSIGIFGEWGTGKTTLMKLIEKKLREYTREEVFIWNNVPQNDNDNRRLKSFLKDNYKLDWIENSQFVKDPNNKTLSINDGNPHQVVDNKGSYHEEYDHIASIELDDKKKIATLRINNNFIRELIVKEVDGKASIYFQENQILTVWFNAWKYEREDQFALIALMKTIAYAMGELPQYKEIKRILLRGAVIIGKGVLRNLVEKWIPLVDRESIDELEKHLLPKFELLSQVDKDTIYFDGMHKIEEEMEKITGPKTRDNKTRIVVFIDDLDRCSPKTAVEVFESIKVFLGMEGFIYVVGLSIDVISKLIEVSYGKDSLIKGENYIRKIIQLPITIPEWNDIGIIRNLIGDLSARLDKKYSDLVRKNKDVIARAAELNPREVKRFINNFIITYEIYSDLIDKKRITSEDLLLVQALKVRWYAFYSVISTDEKFRQDVKKYVKLSDDEKIEEITEWRKTNDNVPTAYRNKIFDFESDQELWKFLKNNKEILQIDWKVYRHVVETIKEIKEAVKDAKSGLDPWAF